MTAFLRIIRKTGFELTMIIISDRIIYIIAVLAATPPPI